MLKRLLSATLITLSFSLIQTNAAAQVPAAASEDTKARLNKQETIDLMIQVGRIPEQQRDSRMEQIWKNQSGSKTPRSDFMFCTGFAYLGNSKAQACVGNAFENGLGVVTDNYEAYTWYALALDTHFADKAAEQRVQADEQRVKDKLFSSYPSPTDDDLDDMVKAQERRIAQYREEVRKAKD
jgi:TPR repeat protein